MSAPPRRLGASFAPLRPFCSARLLLVALLPLALLLPAPGSGQTPVPEIRPATVGEDLPVVQHELENGMRFLFLPRTGAPTVSFVTHVGVGGVNETLGSTGIAHLLEHMLFKGTTTVGTRNVERERRLFQVMDAVHDTLVRELARRPGRDTVRTRELRERIRNLEESAREFVVGNELDRILSRNGARNLNATTTPESTVYFVELPSNRAQLWFTLESDRVENPVFREFYAERDVVMEERRSRVETNPGGMLSEAHLATAYRVHPYGVPVIGHMTDLEMLGRREVEAYYRRFYGPNNTVVAIVGDIDVDRMREWADAYFAHLPPGDTPPPVLAREPLQRGERRVEVVYDAQPQIDVGWHVVSEFHPDMPAISMLSAILTGGRSSRLFRRLVIEDRVATSISASSGPGSRYPQLFTISAFPRSPHTTGEVEEAIYDELRRLAETPPEPRELERVRNQLEASRIRRLGSNLGLAFQIAGSLSLYGDWQTTFRLSERLQAVEPEDIQRVVRTYFTRENRTVATLVPPGERPAEAPDGAGSVETRDAVGAGDPAHADSGSGTEAEEKTPSGTPAESDPRGEGA